MAACNSSSEPQTFEKAAAEATDSLVAQTGKLPAFLSRIESTLATADSKTPKRGIVLDPMLDMITGQQTETTLLFERRVTQRMGNKFPQFEFLPFQSASLTRAQYLLTGTMSRMPSEPTRPVVRLSLALTDLRTGIVVAQASALAIRRTSTARRRATTRTARSSSRTRSSRATPRRRRRCPGSKADPYYMERIGAATVISEATRLYNAERYQDALGQYQTALATPQGQQLRAESGMYLTNMKLGHVGEAEEAFGRIVALGIAYNELGVKFLFTPGQRGVLVRSEDQRRLSDVGAADRADDGGVEQLHDGRRPHQPQRPGGDQRSAVAQARHQHPPELAAEQPALAARTAPRAWASARTSSAAAPTTASTSLDRRVEFKIVPCTAGARLGRGISSMLLAGTPAFGPDARGRRRRRPSCVSGPARHAAARSAPASPRSPGTTPGPAMPAAGTRLRDYEITGLIGEGGFGIVYLAWDHSLQRKVAHQGIHAVEHGDARRPADGDRVKLRAPPGNLRRRPEELHQRGPPAGPVRPPSLLKVYRFWEENGTAYMVMPFFEGRRCETRCRLGRAAWRGRASPWLTPLFDALAMLHAAQCFHRDIAPDNILLIADAARCCSTSARRGASSAR